MILGEIRFRTASNKFSSHYTDLKAALEYAKSMESLGYRDIAVHADNTINGIGVPFDIFKHLLPYEHAVRMEMHHYILSLPDNLFSRKE